MHLKKIELSGFKSFARTTVLEFPSKITAIVGPNGSGKSNIAESVRWVMGEQSMKSLRGKKGEDLIWNGSPQVPRMGKASVTMIFDNKDGRIPVEFEEVSIARKIFRDGMNEYYLNDSQVRLKDVIELMARIGLGETKHNIISQGEVDRILMASARERREMLEEALGLRVYQLKKNEAERKLESSEENMKQVEGLLREIAPHLKFLRAQAHKAEMRGSVEEELRGIQKIYFAKASREIDEGRKKISRESDPIRRKQKEIKEELARTLQEVADQEKVFASIGTKTDEEKALVVKEGRRRELERELGRLEGKLEVEREKAMQPKLRSVDMHYVREEIRTFIEEVRSLVENEDDIEEVRSHLHVLMEDLEQLLNQITRGAVEEKKDDAAFILVRELEKTIISLQKEIAVLAKEVEAEEGARMRERERYQKIQQEIRALDNALRAKQEEERDLALGLERFRFEEERLKIQEENLAQELVSAGVTQEEIKHESVEGFDVMPLDEMRKKIERLRGKLEEIGGIDHAVVKEYQETEARYGFLSKEMEDLKHASSSLKELIKELDQHIREDFKKGFSKVKDEFHNYFRIIFGGGRASLQQIDVPLRGGSLEDVESEEGLPTGVLTEAGIDISVDMPRKRIKGLAMLSGGERALTSIALLFAITAVNPPPFLILDETDAALDEANSQRYAAILKELAKRTQLLLVTHNRETMKVAGVLYGVTMGDDGVSKLLSLKFEEAEAFTNR